MHSPATQPDGMGMMSRGGSKLPASPERPPTTAADRITVALAAKAANDLQVTHNRTRLSKTDIVNRAVSLYEFIDAELSAGAEVIIRREDGQDYLVKLM
jgi:hypothetical protein